LSARLVLHAERLQRLRLERGFSQVDLWQASGVHHVTIARIETGAARASLRTIRRLADAFEMPITDLATIEEPAKV
jgi:transcriptional regulator with XRE-family HTH domain